MEARLLTIESAETFDAAVKAAAAVLRAGEIAAVPTETVYGLAANALDERAVRRIYEAKGRPAENPIIVHVASHAMALRCVEAWPEAAALLAQKFWPGPLTLVLRKARIIPSIVTAGGATAGIRWPGHPFMQALIRECGFPLAAPSANPANQISPTTAAHVWASMRERVPLIVDAGASNVGIESTVLDLTCSPPRILRPGMVGREAIEQALGMEVNEGTNGAGALRSPGLLKRHYAPRARLMVRAWSNEEGAAATARELGVPPGKVHVLAHEHIPRGGQFGRVSVIPQDPEAYARALYDELHRSDAEGAELILVEELPEGGAWTGLRDRLKRAAAGSSEAGANHAGNSRKSP